MSVADDDRISALEELTVVLSEKTEILVANFEVAARQIALMRKALEQIRDYYGEEHLHVRHTVAQFHVIARRALMESEES
jgi:hypothetical protein